MKTRHGSPVGNTLHVCLLLANCANERRQTDRQNDTQTDRQTDRQRDMQTNRQTDRMINRLIDRQTGIETYRLTDSTLFLAKTGLFHQC